MEFLIRATKKYLDLHELKQAKQQVCFYHMEDWCEITNTMALIFSRGFHKLSTEAVSCSSVHRPRFPNFLIGSGLGVEEPAQIFFFGCQCSFKNRKQNSQLGSWCKLPFLAPASFPCWDDPTPFLGRLAEDSPDHCLHTAYWAVFLLSSIYSFSVQNAEHSSLFFFFLWLFLWLLLPTFSAEIHFKMQYLMVTLGIKRKETSN